MGRVQNYLNNVSGLLDNAPTEDIQKAVDLVRDAYLTGKQVFVLGNGGSAATASHLTCDLQKSIGLCADKKFKVMGLTDSIPLITAWANDFDYSDVFAQQLDTWVQPGDLVIAFSGSGNSPNVIKAVELANDRKAVTIGLSGFQGGKLAQVAQYNINVPSDNMQHIEDLHMVYAHLIFRCLWEELTA